MADLPSLLARAPADASTDPRGDWPTTDVLEQYTTPQRIARIDHVLRQRLVSVTAVFEDVFDPHNVAACLRTCEGMGVHDVHLATNRYGARLQSTVAKSADQWLCVQHWRGTHDAVRALKAAGFQLWVSDLQAERTIDAVPVAGKIALVVGNAVHGISDEMRAAADVRYLLPMRGMVQSYNLSVALALSLQAVVPERRRQLGERGDMDLERMWRTRRRWLERGLDHADVMRKAHGDAVDADDAAAVRWEFGA
jgi:tRNA (guanosine-2'-O-)-methyltransferase